MSDRTQSYAAHEQQKKEQLAIVRSDFEKQKDKYLSVLPSNIGVDEFKNTFLIAVQKNPRLLEADRTSLWLGLQHAADIGLKPDGREGALVIFGDDDEDGTPSRANQKKKVVFMPMVWGMVKLARNTGNIKSIRANVVYRGEHVVYREEDGELHFLHERNFHDGEQDRSDAAIMGAYAVVQYLDGGWDIEFMFKSEIDRVRSVSKARKGPWFTWYPEMSKKCPMRRLWKRLATDRMPKRLQLAIEHDNIIDGEAEDLGIEIAHEFTAEKQETHSAPPPRRKRTEPPADAEEKMKPPSSDSQVTTRVVPGEDRPAPGPVGGGSETARTPPTEILPVDEFGEHPSNLAHEPMGTIQFARWLSLRLESAEITAAEVLIENNADNIADASLDPAAKVLIENAIAAWKEATAPVDFEAASRQLGQMAEASKMQISDEPPRWTPIAQRERMRLGGKIVNENYRAAAKDEIRRLQNLDDMADWIGVNEKDYKGYAVELAVENYLAAKRKVWEEHPRQEPPEPPMPVPDLNGKSTAQIHEFVLTALKTLYSKEAIETYFRREDVNPFVRVVKTVNDETFKRIEKAINQRIAEVAT